MKRISIAQGSWQYVPGYLDGGQADRLLSWLLRKVSWQTEEIFLFGQKRQVPRLVAWFGDAGCCYRYSHIDHPCTGWPQPLMPLTEKVGNTVGARPDFLLLNRYRSGSDSMGWHADDEEMVGHVISSISLGCTRRFLIRTEPGRAATKLDLEHGSLLLMDRRLPHCLPKTKRPIGERVNLSFRTLA